jgi:hypothetical protein
MKTKAFFLLMILCIMFPVASNAQFGALRKAINKSIDNKIDSSRNKNKEPDSQSGNAGGGTKETGRGLFGGKIDIKYNDEYKFTGRIYMIMEMYDKNDVTKSDFFTYFNTNTMNAGIEVKPVDPKNNDKAVPTTFLFDNDNRCFMILLESDGSKTGIISTLPSDSAMTEMAKDQKKDPSKAVITKTGNSRMIAGYKCDEYKIVEPEKDGYSNVWMTRDVKIKADKKYWGKAGMPTYYNYPGFEGAIMLAMESFDKKNNPVMKMETQEINEDFKNSISTAGYTFMKMNFGQAGKK